ncbi:uncharacterized protein LOC141657344 [Silene latifolia]|uniref:uncharacterized protein LOC141657344 n=1 Tax=Silene latifolia TaxID=37657 RepID=UPI003D775495
MASQNLDLQTLRSKIAEFTDFLSNPAHHSLLSSSDSDKLLQDFVVAFEPKANQIVADHADVANFNDDDLDAYMDRLRAELEETEAESASMGQEIDELAQSYVEGTCRLESNLQSLRHVVDCAESKVSWQAEAGEQVGKHLENDGYHKFAKPQHVDSFEISKLKYQIEMNEVTLKSFQELDLELKRVEAIEKINEALTGLKVIDVEGNTVRLSLTTYIPYVEVLMSTKPSEVNHELLIEVLNGTMEIKRVEIFPDDVYIGEIVEAANTFSKLFWGLQETRSTLGWFLQKVQDRIVMCTLRQLVVKNTNNSRHSFEYLDKDETVIAHMTGGADAYLKPSQGWPLSGSELKLVSLRSSDQNAKEISLSLLSKVEEVANSLDFDTRKSITKFVDGIEEILLEKMRREVH